MALYSIHKYCIHYYYNLEKLYWPLQIIITKLIFEPFLRKRAIENLMGFNAENE